MPSRLRALLIVAAIVTSLVVVLYFISSTILLDGFNRLEIQDTRQNVERAVDALSAELRSLDSKTGDWANWDDAYAFVQDGNPAFIKTNINDTSFVQLTVEAIVFVNSSGRVVLARAFNLDTEQAQSVPPGLLTALGPQSPLLKHSTPDDRTDGILILPEGPLMIASRPILTSEGQGPIRGTLLFGRFLDARIVRMLAETTQLSLTLNRLSDPDLPPDFRTAIRALSDPAAIAVSALDESTIAGYKILQDVNGVPSLLLRATLPREIHAQGLASTHYLLASLIVVGLGLGVLAFVLALRLADDIARRKRVEGELRQARDHLELRVMERTTELSQTNEKLQVEIAERERAEGGLHRATEELKRSVDKLERQHREVTLLNEFGDLLQICATVEEANGVISQFGPILFPHQSGAVYITSPSRSQVEAVATWGQAATFEKVFAPDQCWALRRGRAYTIPDTDSALLCQHMHPPLPAGYLCVPMMAQGETRGILHLRCSPMDQAMPKPERETTMACQERMVIAVAEHIALALTNLELRETLSSQAIRDPLTGLFNRRYMEETLERELRRAGRRGAGLGVIMMDLDHFKQFNDSYGHGAGDIALRELGNYLMSHIRAEDIACRYGGEEFFLILPDVSPEDVTRRAEQLQRGIRDLGLLYRNQPLTSVSASLGVAFFPEHGSTVEALIHAADAALYHAKRTGRDRVALATVPVPAPC